MVILSMFCWFWFFDIILFLVLILMLMEDTEKAKQTPSQIKVNYVECDKGGLHFGEVCNMVCMEPSCLEDLICCCACV